MLGAARRTIADPARMLFDAIGDFLRDNRLDVEPVNYAFAHRVLTQPDAPLAKMVARLTDGNVRLNPRDVAELSGGTPAAPVAAVDAPKPEPAASAADALVARTQVQVDGVADLMAALSVETQGFGRDLAASADAMRRSNTAGAGDEVLQLAVDMLARVRTAEARLDVATSEVDALRDQLDEARGDARRDPLTDLPNRRAFCEAFGAAAARSTPLCVALCDIDHFKEVNDRFGHAIGDRVLKAVGEMLAGGCGGQVVARYGGEEFAVLFDGVSRDDAIAALDATRRAVAAKRYRIRESAEALGAVTFSAGLVEVAVGEECTAAVARADALLYDAKNDGRNRLIAG